jgi:DNA-binding NarL/FixJ family response regulator
MALVALLQEQPGIIVIGDVADTKNLLAMIENQVVDVILLDFVLSCVGLSDLIARIHEKNRSPRVIIMSSNPENARLALNSGADFFVSKGNQSEWLLETLHRCERQ